MKRTLLLIAGIALLAVACRAEVNVLVDINEDRSGTAAFEFGLDEELLGFIESTGGSVDDLFGELDLGVGDGVPTTRTEGDMTFTGVTKEFDDVDEVKGDLEGETDADGPFSEFSFEMDDETAELVASVFASEQDLGDVGLDPAALTGDIFSASFILGMPGTIVEHDADEVLADGRLRWELPLLGGEKNIYARSEFGTSSLWWLWIVLGVVLVVGVAAIIAAIVLGKRQSKQAVSDAASQYPQPAVAPVDESEASPEQEPEEPEEPEDSRDPEDSPEPEEPEAESPVSGSGEPDAGDPSDDKGNEGVTEQ
jgi:hypothetical protein